MAIKAKHNDLEFGVGDVVRVHQLVREVGGGSSNKTRTQVFEGAVIGIKNRGMGKTFTVRRIGSQKVGIEQIYPLESPTVQKVEVVRGGVKGVRKAKLYYIRDKSRREVETIYKRESKKVAPAQEKDVVKKPQNRSAKKK